MENAILRAGSKIRKRKSSTLRAPKTVLKSSTEQTQIVDYTQTKENYSPLPIPFGDLYSSSDSDSGFDNFTGVRMKVVLDVPDISSPIIKQDETDEFGLF